MSLLNVPSPSSPATSLPTSIVSLALSIGIRPNSCATSLGDGLPGRLAGPIANTCYEPKFCTDVDSEHRPINLPSRNMSFPQEYDATITASEDLNLPGASSSSQHSAASWVPTMSKLGALGASLTKVLADRDSVVGRTGIKETCADMDRETVVSSLFESVSKEKRDRYLNVVQTLRDRQNIHKILERKVELAVRGEKLARQRSHEAEADVEAKYWEKRNSDIALYEINQEVESQRLQLSEIIKQNKQELMSRRCIKRGILRL